MINKNIVLIGFYNQKAIGIRYLAKALKQNGYNPTVIFFKNFNSKNISKPSDKEIELLCDVISKTDPIFIGLSVMTSFYMDTVNFISKTLKSRFDVPIVWGGVVPTMFPEKSLRYSDFVLMGEGDDAIVELADSVFNQSGYEGILNLAYKKGNTIVKNNLRPLTPDINIYGYPEIDCCIMYSIDNERLSEGDPLRKSLTYETSASRGCPYGCSYCCSGSLKRLYPEGSKYVRVRSVDSLIEELEQAKSKMPKLKYIYFWDEIFSGNEKWVKDFCSKYKAKIGLPFQIWCHPLMVKEPIIKTLVDSGLYKAVMGIQSGSPRIRNEIFNRHETNKQILEAGKILHKCKVPHIVYDFMLQHPFENTEDIRSTYELCMQLDPPFELQLHGLNFLPGTDIIKTAVEKGIMSPEEAGSLIDKSTDDQYKKYWKGIDSSLKSNYWYSLIYMSQFKVTRTIAQHFARKNIVFEKTVYNLYNMLKVYSKFRNICSNASLLFKKHSFQ